MPGRRFTPWAWFFYELVTGKRPYEADTPMAVVIKHITEPLPRPRQFVHDLPDEVESAGQLTVADRETDERVGRPRHGVEESSGDGLERSAQGFELDLRPEVPRLLFPEVLHDLLLFGKEKSRVAGFGEPRSLRDTFVTLIAQRFGDAQIEMKGVHLEGGEVLPQVGLEGSELNGRPVEQGPRG